MAASDPYPTPIVIVCLLTQNGSVPVPLRLNGMKCGIWRICQHSRIWYSPARVNVALAGGGFRRLFYRLNISVLAGEFLVLDPLRLHRIGP